MAWLSAWSEGDCLDLDPFDPDAGGVAPSITDEPCSRDVIRRLSHGFQTTDFATPVLPDHLPPA